MKKLDKQYIIRKYVIARSAQEAIKKEKLVPVDDVWIDEDWKKENAKHAIKIGFK